MTQYSKMKEKYIKNTRDTNGTREEIMMLKIHSYWSIMYVPFFHRRFDACNLSIRLDLTAYCE